MAKPVRPKNARMKPPVVFEPMPEGEYMEVNGDELSAFTSEGWRLVWQVPSVESEDRQPKNLRRGLDTIMDIMAMQQYRHGHLASGGMRLYFDDDYMRHQAERIEEEAAKEPPATVMRLRYLLWRPHGPDHLRDLAKARDAAVEERDRASAAKDDAEGMYDVARKEVAEKDKELGLARTHARRLEEQNRSAVDELAALKTKHQPLMMAMGKLWRHFGEATLRRVLGTDAENPVPVQIGEELTAHERLLKD